MAVRRRVTLSTGCAVIAAAVLAAQQQQPAPNPAQAKYPYPVVRDMRGVVPRFTSVRLEGYDRDGRPMDLVAKDFFARVIQHETDHLDGVVYVDRMRDLSTLSFISEWNKHWLGIVEQDD